jgi:hypothetical protein
MFGRPVARPRSRKADLKGKTMTMTSPILATALIVAAAAILAMRATVVAASRKSMVKVPIKRHPANTKTQG